jgi:hypothetical protein
MYDNYSVWIEGLAKSILFIAMTFTSWIIKREKNEALATGQHLTEEYDVKIYASYMWLKPITPFLPPRAEARGNNKSKLSNYNL